MLRASVCVLPFVSALAAEFQAPLDALPTLEHQRISECTSLTSEGTFDVEELSLMQKHAHVHTAHKAKKSANVRPAEHPSVLRDAPGALAAGEFATQGNPPKSTVLGGRLLVTGMVSIIIIVWAGMACFMFDPRENDGEQDGSNEEVEARRHEDLPADTLGFVILAVVRDAADIKLGRSHLMASVSRIMAAASILLLNIGLQVYLFCCILMFVVPAAVSGIRETYEQYELAMYDNHTTYSLNGEIRGLPGFFNPAQFNTLDLDLQQSVCAIPLGQPGFFWPLLFIWTLRCMTELKNSTDLFYLLIIRMPTVNSMSESLEVRQVPAMVSITKKSGELPHLNVRTIVGLTYTLKIIITLTILLPRMIMTCVLCWLGSRWLAAASDFGNLVLDAVAVEFLLMLKELLYLTLVSDRNKRDMDLTQVRPETKTERATLWVYVSSSMWVFLGAGWVYFYCTYFQMVLLDYRWDISEVCSAWMSAVYPRSIL